MYKENIKMKKIQLLILLLIVIFTPLSSYAQDNDSNLTTTTKYFDITMERGGQAAWNKAVTYYIYVTPKMKTVQINLHRFTFLFII